MPLPTKSRKTLTPCEQAVFSAYSRWAKKSSPVVLPSGVLSKGTGYSRSMISEARDFLIRSGRLRVVGMTPRRAHIIEVVQ